jgi:hypothetical protein
MSHPDNALIECIRDRLFGWILYKNGRHRKRRIQLTFDLDARRLPARLAANWIKPVTLQGVSETPTPHGVWHKRPTISRSGTRHPSLVRTDFYAAIGVLLFN